MKNKYSRIGVEWRNQKKKLHHNNYCCAKNQNEWLARFRDTS